jgi:hypothetical protein
MEKEEFPASRDEVLEELLTIETITNMCYNGVEGKKKSNLTPSNNVPVMITLKDGSQGFQREDGKFDNQVIGMRANHETTIKSNQIETNRLMNKCMRATDI